MSRSGLEILGKNDTEIETRVTDVLELVGLADKTRFISRCSCLPVKCSGRE